jgi:hypothetical protein
MASSHAPDRTLSGNLPSPTVEAALQVFVALAVTIVSVSCFAVSIIFGVVATFFMTLAVVNVLPWMAPVVVVCTFLYQNVVVAWFTPYIPDNNAFDALRGANFIVVMTAYGAFFLASLGARVRAIAPLRPWLLWAIAVAAVVTLYLMLGVARGNAKDAILYFRNTIIPLACFHIAIVAASLYRIDLHRALLWLGAGIVVYGYCELFFTLDFLSLFNGDLYIQRAIKRQIESGAFEKTLQETGYVVRGLQDVMTTAFFNTPLFADIMPRVFRIGGPNYHPISFAYALGIMALWLLFRGRWLLPLAALPLLLVIGSKGAMFLVLVGLFVQMARRPFGPRLTTLGVVAMAVTWVAAAIAYGSTHGDYHVLGFLAGLRDFLRNPAGQGLGFGGNLSSTSLNLDWGQAQAMGATSIPVESAIGVMLYQMGVGSAVFFAFLAALAMAARRQILNNGNTDFWFAFVAVVAISANAVLQEEAFYSPLALGFALLLTGVAMGTSLRTSTWNARPPARRYSAPYSNPLVSNSGLRPATRSASSFPEPQAVVQPRWPWPVSR